MTYADRLDQFLSEGRLIRNAWRGQTADGRETACLLSAMFPEVRDSVTQCPAGTIPLWWAELTLRIDDCGTDAAWPETVRRYARVAHRWHVLTDADWQRLLYQCLAVSVREARSHCPEDEKQALAAIDGVLALLDRAARGESVTRDEWSAAEAAARAASARASARAAAAAATAAAAAKTAAKTAAEAEAAAEAAQDRMSAGWLDAVEAACAVREAA